MSARLDDLIAGARERDVDAVWDVDRAGRVRAGALHARDVRSRRDRALRRGALVAGGAGLLLVCLLRMAGATSDRTAERSERSERSEEVQREGDRVALHAMGDAGYARD